MYIHNYLHNTLGYTNYEIAQMHYFISSILSEISKMILIGVFFLLIDKFFLFIPAALTLCCLRICTGGLHFKHYLSCLTISFAIFFMDICILNKFTLLKPIQLLLLCICIVINYTCAPVVSIFRPVPNGTQVQRAKKQSFWLITVYCIIVFILPTNSYINVGFWMIMLQSIELSTAKILKRRFNKNEKSHNVSSD